MVKDGSPYTDDITVMFPIIQRDVYKRQVLEVVRRTLY